MPKKTNLTISEVKKGPSGESQYGRWQIYNIKFEGGKNQYTYFEKNNYKPMVGDRIDFAQWKTEIRNKDGKEYENHVIEEIVLSDNQNEKPHQTSPGQRESHQPCPAKEDVGPQTMWGKYIGEFVNNMIAKGYDPMQPEFDEILAAAVDAYTNAVTQCMRNLRNIACPKNQDPFPHGEHNMPDNSDEPPLPEEPPI